MNKYKTTVILTMLLAVFLLQSHSAGRANGNNRDNTGAPGSQMGGNGMQISCINCHSGGNIEVGLDFELLDEDNNSVTQYRPNAEYTARVTLTDVTGTPEGYGFQMVGLFDSDNADVNGWIDSEVSANAQLSLAQSTGRIYAEHDGTSDSNEFSVGWAAPEAGSGDISFYVVGVGVNGNQASSGDHAVTPIRIVLPENTTTSTANPHTIQFSAYPNPSDEVVHLSGNLKGNTINLYQFGHLVRSHTANSDAIDLSVEHLTPGLYFMVISDPLTGTITTKKLIKL